MIRRIVIIMQIWFVSVLAMGQSESKTINTIKRDKSYLYEEATDKDSGEAYQTAYELLRKRIEDAMGGKELHTAIDVKSKIEQIQMRRGDLTRVFLYVKKNFFEKETQEEMEKAEPKGFTHSGDASLKLPIVWQQAVIDGLLKCKTIAEAKIFLNRQKAEFKVKRYGIYSTCPDKPSCFWITNDEHGNLLTVLGPEIEQRTNFKTLSKETVNIGSNAIWFTLAK